MIDFIKNSQGPVSDAIKELIASRFEEKQEEVSAATEAVRTEVAATKARVREKARKAVERAEKN